MTPRTVWRVALTVWLLVAATAVRQAQASDSPDTGRPARHLQD